MDQLQGEMDYDEDDFSARLGRKKPDLEVVKIEGDMPGKGMDEMSDEDMEMDENPEDELKKRLMNLRG